MTELTCHLPGWNTEHRPLYRRQSTPPPPSIFAATAADHFDLQQLIRAARPQIERARRLGLLKFAEAADDGKDSQLVD